MKENIERTFRELISALHVGRLYGSEHSQFKKSVEKAYTALAYVLNERQELVMGIVGEEIAFEKEIFFELSEVAKPIILFLKDRGIEKICFLRGIQAQEIGKFISFLLIPKEDMEHEIQEYLSGAGIKNIVVSRIKVAAVADKVREAVDHLSIYEDSLHKVNNSIETLINEEMFDQISLRYALKGVMENLIGRYQELLDFATVKKYDTRTFSHILNVSILAMYFSSRLGMEKEDVLDIGTAALFHDIGKIYISRKLIRKESKLSEEEFAMIKSHVVLGAGILLKHVDKLGVLPVVVSFEHHLKYNLTGYPKLAFAYKPHMASLIVSICDVYDALSQRRGYKRSYPPEAIYELMIKEKGSAFEPNLLDRFFKIVGVWPVGTKVQLSDGRIATVKEVNSDEMFLPKVEVSSGEEEKKEIVDLKTEKGRLKIEHSVDT